MFLTRQMSMFRTAQKLRGTLTLFHDPSSSTSTTMFQKLETAFPDPTERAFDIEITEEKPTPTQFSAIQEFDRSVTDKSFKAPLLVDWFNGRTAKDMSTAEQIFEELH